MRILCAALAMALLSGCFAGFQEKVRVYDMHAADSTPQHPKCLAVRQKLNSIHIGPDQNGSFDFLPDLDFEYHETPCTPAALPYSARGTFKSSPLGYEF